MNKKLVGIIFLFLTQLAFLLDNEKVAFISKQISFFENSKSNKSVDSLSNNSSKISKSINLKKSDISKKEEQSTKIFISAVCKRDKLNLDESLVYRNMYAKLKEKGISERFFRKFIKKENIASYSAFYINDLNQKNCEFNNFKIANKEILKESNKSKINSQSLKKDDWVPLPTPYYSDPDSKSYSVFINKSSIEKIVQRDGEVQFDYEIDYIAQDEWRNPGTQIEKRTIRCGSLAIFNTFKDKYEMRYISAFNNPYLEQEALYVCKEENIKEKFSEAVLEIDGWVTFADSEKVTEIYPKWELNKFVEYKIHIPSLKSLDKGWISGKTRIFYDDIKMFSPTFNLKLNCTERQQYYNGKLMQRIKGNEWWYLFGDIDNQYIMDNRDKNSSPSAYKANREIYLGRDRYMNSTYDYVCANIKTIKN